MSNLILAGVGEQILRLVVAMVVGVALGMEREWREKAAGLRTMTLVSVGSALFTMYANYATGPADSARLAAGVVTGIGFLGAGVILRGRGQVVGLTTAATVWMSSALGMGAGFGAYALVAVGTVLALVALLLFSRLDVSGHANEDRGYQAVAEWDPERYERFLRRIRESGLWVRRHALSRRGSRMYVHWHAVGKPADHLALARSFVDDPEVSEFGEG